MSRFPWIVGLGGGAAALYFWSRNKSSATQPTSSSGVPTPATTSAKVVDKLEGRWVWPVPSWQGRKPTISDGFYSPRAGYPLHGGADLMYARLPSDPYKAGSPNGTKGFVMPDGLTALAASDGVVWSAFQTPQGFAIVIDHGKRGAYPVSTFYTHLDHLLVKPTDRAASKERVAAGQPIGVIGFSPLDPEKIKHLHFELRLGGAIDRIDPAPVMRSWPVIAAPVPAAPVTTSPTPATLVARNGTTKYRPIGARGAPYPQWVRDLKGRSGVYLIRDDLSRELLYVGSSSRRLYDTLTRHFQVWRRYKSFWSGQYSEGHDPGLTYDRARVEVAVHLTAPDDSLDEEARLIARLRPRDNLLGQPTDEAADEVPF
jgi:hypothetical protein